jgi:negative regulator of sigma E activity
MTYSRYGLFVASAAVLGASFWLWNARREGAGEAAVLVKRTFQADNDLEYSAISSVTAMYGGHRIQSLARVVRAPRKMAITYTEGDKAGLESGYNDRWFWRRVNAESPMVAYAEVSQRPSEIAARRFKLMMKNYRSYLLREDEMDGHKTQVVELRPIHLADNAKGPIKQMWIDRQSGLTLRSDSYNYQNQLIMRSVLSQVDLTPEITSTTFAPPAALQKAADSSGWIAREMGIDASKVIQQTGIEPPLATWVPAGFELDGYGVHSCPPERSLPILASLTRYTDGLNTLTVFAMRALHGPTMEPEQEKGAPNESGQKASNRAADNSCDYGPGTMVMLNKGDLRLLAVADLPPVTLKRVLESTNTKIVSAPPVKKNALKH